MIASTLHQKPESLSFRFIAITSTLFMLMSAAVALGDTVDDSLPANSPAAVKVSARQAIQSGLAPQPVIELTKAMLQHQFDEQQVQRAHALLTEAKTSNTPVQPLMNKAFEGMAKNVPPALIVGAMETVQARNSFAFARAANFTDQPSQAHNLGHIMAASLAAGFSKEDANEVIGKIQQHASSLKTDQAYNLALECFQTARDVSRLGVSSQAVTGIVVQALSKGFNHEDMQSLRSSFMMQAQQTDPQNLAHGYTAAMQEGKGFQGGAGIAGGHSGVSGSGGAGSGGSGGSGGGSGGSGGSGGGSGGSGGSGGGSGGSGGSGGGSGGSGGSGGGSGGSGGSGGGSGGSGGSGGGSGGSGGSGGGSGGR